MIRRWCSCRSHTQSVTVTWGSCWELLFLFQSLLKKINGWESKNHSIQNYIKRRHQILSKIAVTETQTVTSYFTKERIKWIGSSDLNERTIHFVQKESFLRKEWFFQSAGLLIHLNERTNWLCKRFVPSNRSFKPKERNGSLGTNRSFESND